MKTSRLDPRKYPVIHVYWSGCGDDGGIEEIHALTQAGKEQVIQEGHLSDYGKEEWVACNTYTRESFRGTPVTFNAQINLLENRTGGNYELDRWIYDKFNLCEVNDGSYGNIYVDLATRKTWGRSYNWVTDDVLNVEKRYED